MSSNDFDGPTFRPAGRGADGQGAGDQGAGHDAPGAGSAGYAAPEGWETGGFWRDSSIDSDYETNLQGAIRPVDRGPRQDPGYSYWADGKGWENSPGASAQPGQPGQPGQPSDPTSYDMTRAYGAGPAAGYGGATGYLGGPAGPGGPGGPGGPWGPGPAGPGGPGGRRGRNGKRKVPWWRPTWKKALAVTGGLFLLLVGGMVGVYEYLSSSAVIPAALQSANYQNTIVYYSDGKTILGTIGTVNRQDLTYQQLPANLKNAVLAAEDKNFFTEGGISPTGILRSAYNDLMHGSTSGGSTITQEFVRNYYSGIGVAQTASRKIKEIFIAQKLAGEKSKPWILTSYLNLIYLGDGSYGIAAAAQTYFGLPVNKLSVGQDAVLASIIQQPSTYPLLQYRSNLKARWSAVLGDMVKDNFITQAQANAATFPKLLTDATSSTPVNQVGVTADNTDPWAPYILNVVKNELTGVDNVTQQQLETGGLRVVTTVSRRMEAEMYKAVNQNIAAIKTAGGTVPWYIRIGAELQNPSNGEILAMYPGPGQNMTTAKCKRLNCDENTAVYAREQVGSSFKPYVLSAAVANGMNVKTSILNAAPALCVPPDYDALKLSTDMKYYSTSACSQNNLSSYFPVQNDGGEVIGDPKKLWGVSPQTALAQSSNTAFTDLAHRVTTSKIIQMAQSYGVNIAAFTSGGSNLSQMVGQVGLALGTASLTVNEQATMLSSIADNGVYHTAHLIKFWQQPDGPQQKPLVQSHGVLDPTNATNNAQLASQVQYAMSMTTVNGTGTAAAVGLGSRPIIAKTGTTTNSHSGFFIGAIPQYSLVVGIFTESQAANSPESLTPLTGGGFGGFWPAKIWNTFAQAEFANLPVQNFENQVFSGAKWNQIGKLPKKKATSCSFTVNGRKITVPLTGKNKNKKCTQVTPTPTPTPTPTQTQHCNGRHKHCGNTPTPTPTVSSSPTPSTSPSPTPSNTTTGTPTGTATATPTNTATGPGNGKGGGTATVAGVQAGLAVGGVLTVLPGSLLWTTLSRRRRRRGKGTAE